MSLSAGQGPGEGQHSPGTGGKHLSQKPSHSTFSPYPVPRAASLVGAAAGSILRAPGAPGMPVSLQAEAQVPSSGTRVPVGQTGVPRSLAVPPHAALPSSPQNHPLPSPRSPFSHLCVASSPGLHLSSFSRCFISPLSHVPTSSLSSMPCLGCGHLCLGLSQVLQAPRAGTAKPLKDSSPPGLTKQGNGFVMGLSALFRLLSCHLHALSPQ